MALKDTISKWHASICFLEDGYFSESIQKFLQISNPSAKIIYNVGCVYMILDNVDQALQYFCHSIEKDKYLVIAYFLRGVCYCKTQRFDLAQKDFSGSLTTLPEEGINYQQLGASVSLERGIIEEWLQAAEQARKWKTSFPRLQPLMNYIFRPPKKMVASLKKEDFLGRAKVISSVQENDIIYAEEKKMVNSFEAPVSAGRLAHPLLPPGQKNQRKSRAIPPPPVRRPPHLTASVKEKCRRRWKSMELLCGDQKESFEASPRSSGLGYQFAEASDDSSIDSPRNYDHLSEADQDSDHSYQPMMSSLSTSCPHIETPPRRPLRPPRPKAGNKVNKTSQPVASSLDGNSSAVKNHIFQHKKIVHVAGPSSQPHVKRSVPEPLSKPLQIEGTGSEEATKSVLARAHPSLFQGIPSPSSPYLRGNNAREPFFDMRDGRGPNNVKQNLVLQNRRTNSSNQNGKQTKMSPKPPRPPPPKTFR